VLFEEASGRERHQDAGDDAGHRAERAEHKAIREHDPTHMSRSAAIRRHQREFTLPPAGPDGERRSGQKHHLKQRHAADHHGDAQHRRRRVVRVHAEFGRVEGRRVQNDRPRPHQQAVLVELTDLLPGDRLRRVDQPGRWFARPGHAAAEDGQRGQVAGLLDHADDRDRAQIEQSQGFA
jgi:hypothetical protein